MVYVYPPPPPRPSGLATASLVFGLIGIFAICLFGIPGIVAIVCGHKARRQIREGRAAGDGRAVAGLILGYLTGVWPIIYFIGSATGSIKS
ncbi:DUF4190 domain-containing protein [Streptosporangium canum]|uniref:DUF4190 domain-containing protein n=1 Tax=Streptosporangium canum TaxID=324952 RepID=UPI0033B044DC